MKSVLTLVEAVEIALEMKNHRFWTFSIGYLSLYSKSQIILSKKIQYPSAILVPMKPDTSVKPNSRKLCTIMEG